MTGSAEREDQALNSLAALLSGSVADAIRAARGFAGGVYLRSSSPELLRLAVLAGLPGQLFRGWWRMPLDRPFPAADSHRLGMEVLLTDATETMRRYPQLAAGLPFQFGSLYVPVVGASSSFGVLTVLRPSASDANDVLPDRDRMTAVAENLGTALSVLEKDGAEVVWDGEPMCVRPPVEGLPRRYVGRFTWDPVTGEVTGDDALWALLGTGAGAFPGTPQALTHTLALDDPHVLLAALHETAAGRPPAHPLPVHTVNGGLRLLELWTSGNALLPPYAVGGAVIDPGPGSAADGAADLLPEGVFALDRLGLITYVNPRAAELLGRPRPELLGRPLWQAVPWLNQPSYEDHLRGALLSPEPVHFQVARPSVGGGGTRAGPGEKRMARSGCPRTGKLGPKTIPPGRGAGTQKN
ncbi:PAS domain-containing protein, partial [Streptomyces mirabilis]|uniref:PAS domain-containing protein n=1 Tax=Streptomyces mirabilis TaxID=68239 RepID=UPI003680ABF5